MPEMASRSVAEAEAIGTFERTTPSSCQRTKRSWLRPRYGAHGLEAWIDGFALESQDGEHALMHPITSRRR